MPVEAHYGRVVFELAFGAVEDRFDEMLYRLSGVHLRPFGDERRNVKAGGVSLEQTVGEEHQSVAGCEWQRLRAVLVLAPPEGRVCHELHEGGVPVAYA